MQYIALIVASLSLSAVVRAEGPAATYEAAKPDPIRTVTVGLQGGFANTFQLTLGGTFGQGMNWQNRLTVSVNNLLLDGDSLSAFGWSTTDIPTATPNWQAGMHYKSLILKTPRRALVLGGGIQRWLLPSVKSGAQDWIVSGSLNYATRIKRWPVTVSQDSWSLLRSTLPTGSALYTQVNTQHTLLKREQFKLVLRHGPHHTYAWGFYGTQGNRVIRYAGTVIATWKGTDIEAGCRQQFGLQNGIRNNRYWSIQVTRQLTMPFRLR